MEFIFGLLVLGVIAFILTKGFVTVRQSHVAVVERMGKFSKVLEPGWHVLVPMMDSITKRFDMREALHDFEPTAVITKDNATVRINAVTYYRVTDPHSAAYKVQNYEAAMGQLVITTLRNLIGELDLDECLKGRNTINDRLQGIMDEATHPWGLKVTRVEMKEITPLGDIKDAMDKQMVAERTRRAQILEAEGSKRSAVLHAEGAKESAILRAEGEREVVLIKAKAEAEATIISAKAQQESMREIMSVFGPASVDKYLQLRYLETLPQMANGRGATVFMPTELGPLVGGAALAGEAFRHARPVETQALPAQQAGAPQPPRRAPGTEPGNTNVRIS